MNNIRRDFSPTQKQILDLSLLTAGEKEQLLQKWNNTKTNYPQDRCIHQLFEEQVKKTPHKIAVSFENQQLTYQQLNQRANQLARYLQKANVRPETMVGICLERSLDLIVGLLGILKAGGSYVPLDPAYPYDRLAFMLQDLQLPILLTKIGCLERLPQHFGDTVLMDIEEDAIALLSDSNPQSTITAENLAYTIYNSGTGKPKGIQISHHAVVNFLSSMSKEPGMSDRDVMLATTTICFNIASLEIYLPLVVGAEIALVSREVAANPVRLAQSIVEKITVMQAIPSTWRSLLASGWNGSKHLKALCGGEALPKGLARQLLDKVGSLWNMYGAPETTSWATVCKVEPNQTLISIGRPIANTQIYILDRFLRRKSDPVTPVPIGVVGEMWIGGACLARGYFNSEQTSDKFVPNPFTDTNSRLYKTGDLARYLPDGKIEFVGRLDNQVKICGFRVELEDVEATLCQHLAIAEAVVVVRENLVSKDKYLAAYVVLQPQFLQMFQQKAAVDNTERSFPLPNLYNQPALIFDPVFNSNSFTIPNDALKAMPMLNSCADSFGEQQINQLSKQLKSFLQEELDEYAIPSVYIVLEALPVTSNGKVDRRALPEPDYLD
ncbi:MAG: amino acid adenylation domain-containing protein [Chroococcus sp. CMT-3BRIN-NPC107]|jgi:amino acid adenylation domain-containing protein|nr:amino acid adenylation domain-containing protein [Chroococcus sp. CMT-3BRIN-NPC107]